MTIQVVDYKPQQSTERSITRNPVVAEKSDPSIQTALHFTCINTWVPTMSYTINGHIMSEKFRRSATRSVETTDGTVTTTAGSIKQVDIGLLVFCQAPESAYPVDFEPIGHSQIIPNNYATNPSVVDLGADERAVLSLFVNAITIHISFNVFLVIDCVVCIVFLLIRCMQPTATSCSGHYLDVITC